MPHLQELKYDYADQLNEVTLDASLQTSASGALEPGAVLGFQGYLGWAGHSPIFLGYVFDDDTREIIGINFWDQNSHGTPYGTIFIDDNVKVRGANWTVNGKK